MRNLFFLLLFCLPCQSLALPAPDFTLTTSDGQVRRLYQDYVLQGKVVVIEAFFTSCPPCAAHAPHFQTLYAGKKAAYPGKVEFLLLSTLSTDNNAKVATYLTDKALTMPGAGKDGGSLLALQPYTTGTYGAFLGTPTFWVIAPYTGEVSFDVRGNSATATMTLLGQKIDEYLAPPTTCFVRSPSDQHINGVELLLDSPGFDTTVVANGTYSLTGISGLGNAPYTITPRKPGNALDGLSTYDLVLVSKHILGLDTFKQAWRRTAADMNCSNTITTFDIVVGRRLILGIDTVLPCGTWKFLSETQTAAANGSCQHFRGIRLGDVNGSYFSPEPEDRSPWSLVVTDARLYAGQPVTVTLRNVVPLSLAGLQLGLQFEPTALRLEGVESGVLPHFGPDNLNRQQEPAGRLPLVWVHGAGRFLPEASPVLTLHLTALRDGWLSEFLTLPSDGIRPEAIEQAGAVRRPQLAWEAAADGLFATIYPNPASGWLGMRYEAAQDGEVLVQIFDTQGRLQFSSFWQVRAGVNHTSWQPDLSDGLFWVRVHDQLLGKVYWVR